MTRAAILRDLSRARAVFQQRTILAVIGHHTGDRPMTAPTLQRFSPYAVDGGCDAYGQMEEDEFGDYYNREDADAALDAAQTRIAALEAEVDRLRPFETRANAAAMRIAEEFRIKSQCRKCGYQSMDMRGGQTCPMDGCFGGMESTDPPASDTRA